MPTAAECESRCAYAKPSPSLYASCYNTCMGVEPNGIGPAPARTKILKDGHTYQAIGAGVWEKDDGTLWKLNGAGGFDPVIDGRMPSGSKVGVPGTFKGASLWEIGVALFSLYLVMLYVPRGKMIAGIFLFAWAGLTAAGADSISRLLNFVQTGRFQ